MTTPSSRGFTVRTKALVALAALFGLIAAGACDDVVPSTQDRPGANVPTDAPRLRLRVSGNLESYLMPCGCASGQLGGLARRAFRNKLDERNLDLLLEGGNLIKQPGELEFEKLYTTLTVLSDGKPYAAIGVGPADLGLGRDKLAPLLQGFPFVASDLVGADGKPWTDRGAQVVAAFREEKLPAVTVRIGSLTMSLPSGDTGKQYALLSPADGWKRAMDGVDPATYRVLFVHADREAIRMLHLQPRPDLVVAINHDYVEPPPSADAVDGVPLVFVGVHGRFLVDVTVVRGNDGPMVTHYRPVPLEGSRTAPNAMRDKSAAQIILEHRKAVQRDGLLEKLANRTAPPGGATYIGAKACAACHTEEDEQCKDHAHGHAWKTLLDAEKREEWPVTSYPECVSCHVVGYGQKSGFVSPTKTPDLLNVTCENCHGPGSLHEKSGGDVKVPFGRPPVSTCTQCHNFEHSPKFDYTSYWAKIRHGAQDTGNPPAKTHKAK